MLMGLTSHLATTSVRVGAMHPTMDARAPMAASVVAVAISFLSWLGHPRCSVPFPLGLSSCRC
jgi:hypothetical protein